MIRQTRASLEEANLKIKSLDVQLNAAQINLSKFGEKLATKRYAKLEQDLATEKGRRNDAETRELFFLAVLYDLAF